MLDLSSKFLVEGGREVIFDGQTPLAVHFPRARYAASRKLGVDVVQADPATDCSFSRFFVGHSVSPSNKKARASCASLSRADMFLGGFAVRFQSVSPCNCLPRAPGLRLEGAEKQSNLVAIKPPQNQFKRRKGEMSRTILAGVMRISWRTTLSHPFSF